MSPVALSLPFEGRWLVQNSPARRVPSHGLDLLGQRYAIDFVAVDERGRTAPRRDWRTALSTEPPERFFGFGLPILAPVDGVVVQAHDGESDHQARRSQLALVPYALGQASRVRQGPDALAGNRVVMRDHASGMLVALVHLRAGSLRVGIGDEVVRGDPLAECGNSGNSTQPHVHVQVMDSTDFHLAQGVPLVFALYRQWGPASGAVADVDSGIPLERAIVASLPSPQQHSRLS